MPKWRVAGVSQYCGVDIAARSLEAAVERLEKAHGEGTVGVAAAVARLEGALGQAVRAERDIIHQTGFWTDHW
jgi:hypothetical protein